MSKPLLSDQTLPSDLDWSAVRSQMLFDSSIGYLNTGAFGPLPRSVYHRLTQLRTHLAESPTDFMLREVPSLLWQARTQLATYLGAETNRLLFTVNASAALSLIVSSISLTYPDELLLTAHEYATARWCWDDYARKHGIKLRTFTLPKNLTEPAEIIAIARKAMSPNTRLFFFSHVLSATGTILPVRELCLEAQQRNIISVVDGAQATAFTPINLANIPCDYYFGCGHKWLLMPSGSGFLYFGQGQEQNLQPRTVSWGYQYPAQYDLDRPNAFGSTPRLRRLECEGTQDICPWLVAPEAIQFQANIGHERVKARMNQLATYAEIHLCNQLGLSSATPADAHLRGGIATLYLPPELDAINLRQVLWERFKLEVSCSEYRSQPVLRVSTHCFNNETDIDRLVKALGLLLDKTLLDKTLLDKIRHD